MSDYLRGVRTGLKIIDNFDRNDKLRQARDLALEHRYQDALNLLENVRLSDSEKSVSNLLGFLIKAVCYAEMGYMDSAKNSINVILNMDRLSINPFYQYALSDIKKGAREIKEEYGL